jgi:hypothetical protein
MDAPFIHGRVALADAARAKASRNDGNVAHFCHWRHIERVIATLISDRVEGTVH